MKTVNLYLPSDKGYKDACAFAKRVYAESLSYDISHFPDLLFTITDGNKIIGCMGLNMQVRGDLFVKNKHVLNMISANIAFGKVGEQSIFALEHFSIGAPILIAVVAEYARTIGINKIAYMAIPVSKKVIDWLGFSVLDCGPVAIDVIPPLERPNYVRWFKSHSPTYCLIDTQKAERICADVLEKFSNKIELSDRISYDLYTRNARRATAA